MLVQRSKFITWRLSVLCYGKLSQIQVWTPPFHPQRHLWWKVIYSRGRIFASVWSKTEFHLNDSNTPLNVELHVFIESHFKYTIIDVKLIFRLGFGVKSQNLRARRMHRRKCIFHFKRWKNTTIFEFSWMYRIVWLERNIKGSISSKGSLSETILVRKYEIFKSVS